MVRQIVPRVLRNRWDQLVVPRVGQWRPSMTVSVVVPAYNCQPTLDLTLASLSVQTYPSELTEVIVVDDGSDPPIEKPKIAPARCRIVRVGDHSSGWGRANALHVGALQSTGEILQWLDADMVIFPEHIEAQARWHHAVSYGVVLGYKRFVPDGWSTPEEVVERCRQGDIDELFSLEQTETHSYIEELIDGSDGLRNGDHLNFRAHVGATASLHHEFYLASGGLNIHLRLGEDTEFGYRLAQAGALFIPEPESRSWHMGSSHMTTLGDQLRRYNQPFLAHHIPQARWLRNVGGRTWTVPLVTAVVQVGNNLAEEVRACVDRLLAGDEHDLRVLLVGDWGALSDERRPILGDPLLDLRLIAATYEAEPRVALVTSIPETVFPSPYRLDVPIHLGVGPSTVRRLVEDADRWQAGLLRVVPSGDRSNTIDLWRTAAVSRAHRIKRDGERLEKAVADVHGVRWVSGVDFGVEDLSTRLVAELRSPRPWRAAEQPIRRGSTIIGHGRYGKVVAVGGLRSLVRAVFVVAKLALELTITPFRRAFAALRRRG
jgi:glycosyltransferase involved in cell wall biosynthesis